MSAIPHINHESEMVEFALEKIRQKIEEEINLSIKNEKKNIQDYLKKPLSKVVCRTEGQKFFIDIVNTEGRKQEMREHPQLQRMRSIIKNKWCKEWAMWVNHIDKKNFKREVTFKINWA